MVKLPATGYDCKREFVMVMGLGSQLMRKRSCTWLALRIDSHGICTIICPKIYLCLTFVYGRVIMARWLEESVRIDFPWTSSQRRYLEEDWGH